MKDDPVLDIYVIALSDGRTALFSPADLLEEFEARSDDRIRRFIIWLEGSRFRLVAWLGRVFQSGRVYYVKLEAQLDPVERVLKAMDSTSRYVVYYAPSWGLDRARGRFFGRLRWQRGRHLAWFIVDLVLATASLTLAFIPGPNVLGWYPFLRSLSHYRAFTGARSGLRSSQIEFKGLPELRTLEENLGASSFDRQRIRTIAEDLKINGLERFLERMI